MTRTQAKKNRAATRPAQTMKPRNAGVKYTIQQLKADIRGAGGHFFDHDNTPIVRTHGHPLVGSGGVFFVGSSTAQGGRQFTVYAASADKVKAACGPFVTHARAMQECAAAAH